MASIFPTIYSTLSPSGLAALVSVQYGLTDSECQLLVRGVGDTYLVTSKNRRFILRVYRSSHRTLPQIKAELDLLLVLKKSGVSVSYPIDDLSGSWILSLDAAEGKRYAVLFSYASGIVVSKLSERQLQSLGKQMAHFREVSSTIRLNDSRWTYDLETTLFEPLQRLKPAFSENSEDYEWWVKAASHVEKELSRLDTANFTTGYCQFYDGVLPI
jgi:Ser/Thr protein kinase RdoA (MazF antagonist)